MVDVLRGNLPVRRQKRAFRPSPPKRPRTRYHASLYSEKTRDLPKITDDTRSILNTEGTYVKPRNHRALLESWGHPIRDGHRIGSDNFFVYLDKEDPGLGSLETMTCGPVFLGTPNFPSYRPYQWRPILTRNFDSSVYEPDSGVEHHISTTRDLPDVDTPEFSDFTLDLNEVGTNFIKLCRPGNPVANLGQFVVELRDLPQIPFLESKARYFASLGHEYLNVVFGWEPFVKDLRKVYNLQKVLDVRLQKLIAGNGITQKRTRTKVTPEDVVYGPSGTLTKCFGDIFIDEDGNPIEGLENFCILGPDGYHPEGATAWRSAGPWHDITGVCDYNVVQTKNRVDWYSGLFTYYVPDIGSSRWTDKAVAALHELNVTPSVLYEAYPWSWLLDWFTNVGDIVSNLSTNAVENEVLVNSFVMSRRSDLTEVTAHIQWDYYDTIFHLGEPDERSMVVPPGSAKLVHKRLLLHKLRHPASPYGFGISAGSFTTKQWFILAALGLTHQRSI